MPLRAAQFVRVVVFALSALALLLVAAGGWFYLSLRASRAQLDGRATAAGLGAPVSVTRDALGVPTVRAATEVDAMRALGWLHGQERFFQMDLLRRRGAGELAELFGAAAVPIDRSARLHGFRKIAREIVARAEPRERALAEAYTAGVNAGRDALAARPFEYLVLRTSPQPWRLEDSALVTFAMWFDLQEDDGRRERSLAALRETYGDEAIAFFNPLIGPSDAALDGSTAPLPPIPSPKIIDLRGRKSLSVVERVDPNALVRSENPEARWGQRAPPFDLFPARDPEFFPGSNAFALAGPRTASGAALLANDMHLDHGVPNIWYRAVLEWDDAGGHQRVVGVTLPGAPGIVAGSNGRVAWGFTDAYIDTSDVVVVQRNTIAPSLYRRGDENLEFDVRRETIRVKGGKDVELETLWTVWGPLIDEGDKKHRPLAYRWLAHDPGATNLELTRMAGARTVDEAIAIAHRCGIPAENCLIAGADGTIAWTIAGRVPRRIGFDGRLPIQWTFGDRKWDGMLPPDEVPVVKSTAAGLPSVALAKEGQLWTGNNRALGGAPGALLGDGGPAAPARAAQIRDDLTALAATKATPRDLFAVQLDDRAVMLGAWQKILLAALTPDAVAQNKTRAELRTLVEKWEGRASVDSVSYRLVRTFRSEVADLALAPILEPCRDAYARFDWHNLRYEDALQTLVREKPLHLLDPRFASWDALLLAAADAVVADLAQQGVPLAEATWGRHNTARVRHPFAKVAPKWLTGWLNQPAVPLPGDSNMPRVQSPTHGASERFVVAPGREAEGLFHMPGGQSAHPLSPFFHAGYDAWARGEPAPLLPGETKYTLTLAP
ncbi:MAG: penicillin acylase family protein [Verrucomicrobia bacterium]|nr:penicillin acylase family protein [Verrucomicrobiota bacterium]